MDCLFCNISEERVIAQNELAYAVDTVARLNYRSLVLPTIELALAELTVRQMQVVKILLYRLALPALLIQIAPAGTIMLLVVVSRSSLSI